MGRTLATDQDLSAYPRGKLEWKQDQNGTLAAHSISI